MRSGARGESKSARALHNWARWGSVDPGTWWPGCLVVMVRFAVEQATQLHDQPNGPTGAQEVIVDWLDKYPR